MVLRYLFSPTESLQASISYYEDEIAKNRDLIVEAENQMSTLTARNEILRRQIVKHKEAIALVEAREAA